MTVVGHIRNSAPQASIKRQIKEKGCELTKDGAPSHVVVNLNHPELMGPGSVGDFIFASDASENQAPWDKSWIVAIELTSGNKSSTKVKNQLNAATRVVERLTDDSMVFKFRPVIAFGSKMHRVEIDNLKQEKIRFRGNSFGIKLVRCGSPLSKALLP